MRFKKCSNVDKLLERHKYQKSSRRTVNLDRSVPTNGTEFVFKYLLTKKTTGGPEGFAGEFSREACEQNPPSSTQTLLDNEGDTPHSSREACTAWYINQEKGLQANRLQIKYPLWLKCKNS